MKNLISLYFLFCIPMRYLLYLYFKHNKNYNISVILALFLSFAFMFQYVTKKRNVGAFGQKVWWNNNRIVYSIIYFIYAYYLLCKNKNYHELILLSIIYGIITFLFK